MKRKRYPVLYLEPAMTIYVCYLLYIANIDNGRLPRTENYYGMSLSVKLLRYVVFYKTYVLFFSLTKQRTFQKILVLTYKIKKSCSLMQEIISSSYEENCTLSVEINICKFDAGPDVVRIN